mmetsp:Transcript_12170/g.29748  ORF Transcript_12170/g.29748 Transcript_12170/m.29748 type:complete len:204 (-) Transcript_12170:593-1204(-)
MNHCVFSQQHTSGHSIPCLLNCIPDVLPRPILQRDVRVVDFPLKMVGALPRNVHNGQDLVLAEHVAIAGHQAIPQIKPLHHLQRARRRALIRLPHHRAQLLCRGIPHTRHRDAVHRGPPPEPEHHGRVDRPHDLILHAPHALVRHVAAVDLDQHVAVHDAPSARRGPPRRQALDPQGARLVGGKDDANPHHAPPLRRRHRPDA